MATNALAILSLERMKKELRREESDDSLDDQITGYIEGAVGHIIGRTALPLIDVTVSTYEYYFRISGQDKALIVKERYFDSLTSVQYYNTNQDWFDDPAGTVSDPGDLGIEKHGTYFLIKPPASGWPQMLEVHSRSRLKLTWVRSFEITDSVKQLEQAIIITARDLYNGSTEYMKGKSSVERLISRWTRKGAV